jgi:hypothetical protein
MSGTQTTCVVRGNDTALFSHFTQLDWNDSFDFFGLHELLDIRS